MYKEFAVVAFNHNNSFSKRLFFLFPHPLCAYIIAKRYRDGGQMDKHFGQGLRKMTGSNPLNGTTYIA